MRSKLKLFQGFTRDTASDFTGLRPGEIDWLRQQGIVKPKKRRGSYEYSFTDLLTMRVVRQLKRIGVTVRDMKKAQNYFADISPDQSLINVSLYIGQRTGHIYYIGKEKQENVLVDLTQSGQLVRSDFVVALPIGRDLDAMRRDVIDMDKTLSTRLAKDSKLIPSDEVFKRYGIG